MHGKHAIILPLIEKKINNWFKPIFSLHLFPHQVQVNGNDAIRLLYIRHSSSWLSTIPLPSPPVPQDFITSQYLQQGNHWTVWEWQVWPYKVQVDRIISRARGYVTKFVFNSSIQVVTARYQVNLPTEFKNIIHSYNSRTQSMIDSHCENFWDNNSRAGIECLPTADYGAAPDYAEK